MRLLIVEDDRDIRHLLVDLFEEEGYAAEGVADLAAAGRALAGQRYDLMVLDLLLPDGSGLSLLGRLRRTGSQMPVIVCSGLPDAALRAAMFDTGADAVLDKPFSCSELLARVRALLRRHSQKVRLLAVSSG